MIGDQELEHPVSSFLEGAEVGGKKPRFSMLDDLEELNEKINGPGANEDNAKAQEALQKAFHYMKGSSSDSSEELEESCFERESMILDNDKNTSNSRVSTEFGASIENILKRFNSPKIIVSTKTIDLRDKPRFANPLIKNYEEVEKWLWKGNETRVIVSEKADEGLFGKALHKKKENILNACTEKPKHQTFDSYRNKGVSQNITSLKIKR